jgi:hypothetical protein
MLPDAAVTLRAWVEAGGGAAPAPFLHLSYAVRNRHPVPLYVQHFVETFPAFSVDAYVAHQGGDRALFYCGTPEPPPNVSLNRPGRPGAQRLAAGEGLTGVITRPLPLLESTLTARPDPQAPAVDVAIGRIRLVIEYQIEGRGVHVTRYPDRDVFDAWGPPPERAETEVVLARSVVLRRRTDEFPRPEI